jgi:23S rRNA (adenine2503-C2)-methyltransferase
MGLLANLSTAQIIEQVVAAKRYLESIDDTKPINNVVFMGVSTYIVVQFMFVFYA